MARPSKFVGDKVARFTACSSDWFATALSAEEERAYFAWDAADKELVSWEITTRKAREDGE
jgi:hypothetical protein